ncbi:MAG: DUF192 domain-containing protein [Alphaproteobacteria bacterium]|nr:DUF192 domain-containing protein [Alphaproteobacteria bacterium]
MGAAARPQFQHEELTITRHDGKRFSFDVEIARTPDEQAYGLMFVTSLPHNAGMIFPDNPPRVVAFWMENTYIPLDMLFIRPDHTIGRIEANARPMDTTPIPSQMPVAAVVEINGGEAARDGIAVGDRVDSPSLP